MTIQSNLNQRKEHRNYNFFPVIVHVRNTNGKSLKARTITDNLSQGGVFLQLTHKLLYGTLLFVLIRLSENVSLAATGTVVRTENKDHGLIGIAISFKNTRLLPVPSVL